MSKAPAGSWAKGSAKRTRKVSAPWKTVLIITHLGLRDAGPPCQLMISINTASLHHNLRSTWAVTGLTPPNLEGHVCGQGQRAGCAAWALSPAEELKVTDGGKGATLHSLKTSFMMRFMTSDLM